MMSKYGEALSVQELSKKLRENKKEDSFQPSERYKLIDVFDDFTMAWNKELGCLCIQFSNPSTTLENQKQKVQTISITKPPIWEVQRISINKSGTGVLIWGSHGLAVVELPKRWGNPSLFEGGANSITSRIVYVGGNFFTSSSKLSIVSASWHPGCLTHNHVAVLTNNNCFNVYNLSNPNSPDISVAVGKVTSFNKERSTLSCDTVTGELAVDFDFGGAIFPDNYVPSDPLEDDPEEIKRKYLELQWPVFVLYENGDVYYIILSISGNNRNDNRSLYGPMVMLPSSYDNYGLDYCSLIVLNCSPQVLVIANKSANLHHCIVLEKSLTHHTVPDSVESIIPEVKEVKLKSPNYILHVYESIKLDLSFICDVPKVDCNILLIPDPHTSSRYWISHIEGVHGVSFPLVDRLIHIEQRNLEFELRTDVASNVEHFLCTKPLSSVKSLPVIGLAFNNSPPHVLVLLASGLIYTFPIPNSFMPFIPHDGSGFGDKKNVSQYEGDCFSKHIRNLLTRSTSQPLLISGSVLDIESDEYLLMVASVLRTLKQNYMQPQVKAREEMQRRVNILTEQKKNLLNDINAMIKEKKPLTDRAHSIAEIYEEANEKHSELLTRLEKVMSRIVSDLPTLSGTERAMMNELVAMKDRSEGFEQEISQLRSKNKWQSDEIEKQRNSEANERSNLSENEVNILQNSLNAESNRLKIMKKKVTQLKLEADV